MRIKLDENLPTGIVDALAELGHHVDTVPQEALTGHTDAKVWDAANSRIRGQSSHRKNFIVLVSDIRPDAAYLQKICSGVLTDAECARFRGEWSLPCGQDSSHG
jgi:hypothetical protein